MSLAPAPHQADAPFFARSARARIEDRLADVDCVALLGPRQVGKSDLARAIAADMPGAIVIDLQSPHDRERLGDPETFFRANPYALIILDEIQERIDLFPVLRAQIDERRRTLGNRRGRFLVLGSASLNVRRQAAETLAGRISEIHLTGLQPAEIIDAMPIGRERLPDRIRLPLGAVARQDRLGYRPDDEREALERLWMRGGFPLSFTAVDNRRSMQ